MWLTNLLVAFLGGKKGHALNGSLDLTLLLQPIRLLVAVPKIYRTIHINSLEIMYSLPTISPCSDDGTAVFLGLDTWIRCRGCRGFYWESTAGLDSEIRWQCRVAFLKCYKNVIKIYIFKIHNSMYYIDSKKSSICMVLIIYICKITQARQADFLVGGSKSIQSFIHG
jgi:hypothetical protein